MKQAMTRNKIRKTFLVVVGLAVLTIVVLGAKGHYAQDKRATGFVRAAEQGLVDIPDAAQKELAIDLRQPRLLSKIQNIDFDNDGARLATPFLGVKGALESEILEIASPLDSVVLIWSGQTGISDGAFVKASVRTSSDRSAWSEWIPVEAADSEFISATNFESIHIPVAPEARYLQFKIEFLGTGSPHTPSMDRMRLVLFARESEVAPSQDGGLFPSSLDKLRTAEQTTAVVQGVPAPNIISRVEWGCPDGESAPKWPPVPNHTDNTPITHLVIHHTLLGQRDPNKPNDYKLWVQNIYNNHKYYYPSVLNPFGDIGYNLLIDPKGNIYEGRAGGVDEKGAHFSCYNSHTTGIALLGDFTSTPPTKQALAALEQVLAWRATSWGIDPKIHSILVSPDSTRPVRDINNIAGHRDINPVTWDCGDLQRTCPGDAFYALLPGISSDVGRMVPAGFSIQIQSDSQMIFLTQGQQASIGLTLDSLGGLSGTATLSVSGLPAGASVAPTSVYLPANGTASATLVLKTSLSTPTGFFSPKIIAAIGGIQRSAQISVTVTPAPGTVTVKALYNGAPWSGAVDYDVVGPQGVIIGLAVPGTTSNLTPGQYSFVYNKGGPGTLSSITPSSTQTLVNGGQLTFTLNFGTTVSPLSVICSTSPNVITTGQSTTFTASASGGVGPYLLTWSGAITGTGPTVSKVFNTTGIFYATVTASDGSLQSKQATCSVQVNAAISGSFDVYTFNSSKAVQAGQTVNFDLYFQPQNGFSSQVALSLSGLPAGTWMTSSSQISVSGTSSIPYALMIQTGTTTPVGVFPLVFTASGQGITRTVSLTLTTTAPPPQPLSASCSIVPNPIALGTGATVYGQASGGVSPFAYIINGVNMGYVSSLLVMPSATGTFTVPITIIDSQNQQASSSCSAQVVAGDPYVTGFNYSPNPAKATQVVNLNIYGGNFNSTTEVWFVGPGCSSPGCQTNAVTVSGSAYIGAQAVLNLVGNYIVNIRNGTGAWVQVSTVTVVQ